MLETTLRTTGVVNVNVDCRFRPSTALKEDPEHVVGPKCGSSHPCTTVKSSQAMHAPGVARYYQVDVAHLWVAASARMSAAKTEADMPSPSAIPALMQSMMIQCTLSHSRRTNKHAQV